MIQKQTTISTTGIITNTKSLPKLLVINGFGKTTFLVLVYTMIQMDLHTTKT